MRMVKTEILYAKCETIEKFHIFIFGVATMPIYKYDLAITMECNIELNSRKRSYTLTKSLDFNANYTQFDG